MKLTRPRRSRRRRRRREGGSQSLSLPNQFLKSDPVLEVSENRDQKQSMWTRMMLTLARDESEAPHRTSGVPHPICLISVRLTMTSGGQSPEAPWLMRGQAPAAPLSLWPTWAADLHRADRGPRAMRGQQRPRPGAAARSILMRTRVTAPALAGQLAACHSLGASETQVYPRPMLRTGDLAMTASEAPGRV